MWITHFLGDLSGAGESRAAPEGRENIVGGREAESSAFLSKLLTRKKIRFCERP